MNDKNKIIDFEELDDNLLDDVTGGSFIQAVAGIMAAITVSGAPVSMTNNARNSASYRPSVAFEELTETSNTPTEDTETTTTTTITTDTTTTTTTSTESTKSDKSTLSKDDEKKIRDAVDSFESGMGKSVAQLIKGDVSAEEFGLGTCKLINKTFVKAIPYVGPFVSAFVAESAGFEDASPEKSILKQLTKLDNIVDELVNIKGAINDMSKAISSKLDMTQISEKIQRINDKYSIISDLSDKYDAAVASAIKNVNANNEISKVEAMALENIYKYDIDKNKYELSYYTALKNYYNEITSTVQINSFKDFAGSYNIFEIHELVSNIDAGNNLSALDRREAYINKIEKDFNLRCTALSAAMIYNKEKLQKEKEMLDLNDTITSLRAALKTDSIKSDSVKKKNIQDIITEYEMCDIGIQTIEKCQKIIDEWKMNVKKIANDAKSKIEKEYKADTYNTYTKDGVKKIVKKDWKDYYSEYASIYEEIIKGSTGILTITDCETKNTKQTLDFIYRNCYQNDMDKLLIAYDKNQNKENFYLGMGFTIPYSHDVAHLFEFSKKDEGILVNCETKTRRIFFKEGSDYDYADISISKTKDDIFLRTKETYKDYKDRKMGWAGEYKIVTASLYKKTDEGGKTRLSKKEIQLVASRNTISFWNAKGILQENLYVPDIYLRQRTTINEYEDGNTVSYEIKSDKKEKVTNNNGSYDKLFES